MRILLLGATGLIGSAMAARFGADGHEVVGVTRSLGPEAKRVPVARWVELDLRHVEAAEDWRTHLLGVDAVVNCAGALQSSLRDSTRAVHVDSAVALWRACEEAGIRRVVHISAMGVDRGAASEFSRSKAAGDAALEASGLDWVILRPSVVVGRAAYGGSALLRAFASLPLLPRIEDGGPLDIVQLDDVVETAARLILPDAPGRLAIDLPGPVRMSFAEVVAAYRSWLGWKPAREIALPDWLVGLAWKVGDLVAWFGWRPPVRSTARDELRRGAVGDGAAWHRATGIQPESLQLSLAAEPASVQERWFAKLYLLKPLVLFTFASYWLMTGIISLTAGWQRGVELIRMTDATSFAEAAVIGGALTDLIIGFAILFRRTAKAGLMAALAVSLAYLLLGTLLLPTLWSDPLGAMVKILPILALNLVCLAVLDER